MKQVDFYLISNRVNNAKFKLASRLANKLQRLNQNALIITDNEQETAQLDTVMWSFSDTSFLAHDAVNEQKYNSLIQIGEAHSVSAKTLESDYNALINISSDVPIFNHHFPRIAEIVEQDENAKASARSRYKRYQTEGFEIKTHQIEL